MATVSDPLVPRRIMAEIWLQANRRAAVWPSLGLLASATLFAFMAYWLSSAEQTYGLEWVCMVIATTKVVFATIVGIALTRPRLRYDGKHLLIDVGKTRPVAVPIELVEGFLIGKGPTFLSGQDDHRTETSTLVVRIAERAEEFRKVETNVRLAAWCGHYCTLRGTWTEPLSVDLVNRLNQRLHDVQQAAKSPERVTT